MENQEQKLSFTEELDQTKLIEQVTEDLDKALRLEGAQKTMLEQGGVNHSAIAELETIHPGVVMDNYPEDGFTDEPSQQNLVPTMESIDFLKGALVGGAFVALIMFIINLFRQKKIGERHKKAKEAFEELRKKHEEAEKKLKDALNAINDVLRNSADERNERLRETIFSEVTRLGLKPEDYDSPNHWRAFFLDGDYIEILMKRALGNIKFPILISNNYREEQTKLVRLLETLVKAGPERYKLVAEQAEDILKIPARTRDQYGNPPRPKKIVFETDLDAIKAYLGGKYGEYTDNADVTVKWQDHVNGLFKSYDSDDANVLYNYRSMNERVEGMVVIAYAYAERFLVDYAKAGAPSIEKVRKILDQLNGYYGHQYGLPEREVTDAVRGTKEGIQMLKHEMRIITTIMNTVLMISRQCEHLSVAVQRVNNELDHAIRFVKMLKKAIGEDQ